VSLGINLHSKDKVSMYKPGSRPESLMKAQTQEDMEMDSFVQTKTASNMTPVSEAVDSVVALESSLAQG
jgi:hypothetical protein